MDNPAEAPEPDTTDVPSDYTVSVRAEANVLGMHRGDVATVTRTPTVDAHIDGGYLVVTDP